MFTDQELLKKLGDKEEGELCLASTVIGCRESKDRIEFAIHLKKLVDEEDRKKAGKEPEKKEEGKDEAKPEYRLVISDKSKEFIRISTLRQLALTLPKYDLMTPSLASCLMKEIRNMLCHKELLEILQEKEYETMLPFDALRDLCMRFKAPLSDE